MPGINANKIAEYKFNNTLYDLIPEFNAEFTDYTYEVIVDGEVTTRTIISDDLPTIVRFGTGNASSTNRENSLLEILELKFVRCRSLRTIKGINNWDTKKVTNMDSIFPFYRNKERM